MNDHASIPDRRFYRSKDKAILGGVCAGAADYFGFNLKATRLLTAIAFFMMPMSILAYIAVVVLVPSRSLRDVGPNEVDREFTQALRSSPAQTMSDLRRRFQSLDRRLARLEKYITSSRYQLDREFKELER